MVASTTVTTTTDGRICSPSTRSERLVIFAGPGKTGSTTIQNTYIKYADVSLPENRLPAFANWTVPAPSKFAPYCLYLITPDDKSRRTKTLDEKAILEEKLSRQQTPQNIFWACEFAASIYDKDIYGTPLLDTLNSLGDRCPEIVFNYRTPRYEHFVSGWKERTASEGRFFRRPLYDFVCHEDFIDNFRETTRDYGNPLRGAINYRKSHPLPGGGTSDWPVTIIDMGGADKAGKDVTHVIACEILGVPCNGNNEVEGMNVRRGNVKRMRKNGVIPKKKSDAIEAVFRNRDCYYRDFLARDEQVRVIYNDTLWSGCPDVTPKSYALLDDDEYFMEEIRKIMGCGGSAKSDLPVTTRSKSASVLPLTTRSKSASVLPLTINPDDIEPEDKLYAIPDGPAKFPHEYLLVCGLLTIVIMRVRQKRLGRSRRIQRVA